MTKEEPRNEGVLAPFQLTYSRLGSIPTPVDKPAEMVGRDAPSIDFGGL